MSVPSRFQTRPVHVHNTISHLLDDHDNSKHSIFNFNDEPMIMPKERPAKAMQMNLDSCLMCFKTQDRLNRVVTQLVSTDSKQADRTLEESIEILSDFVETLLAKDRDVEQAR